MKKVGLLGPVLEAEAMLKVENLSRNTVLATRAKVASTFFARGFGLLSYSGLEEGEGLWIVPGKQIHMCGMSFSIDAIFLSRNYEVTCVFPGLAPQPWWAIWRSWSGGRGAHSVLELPVGIVELSGTQPGDKLQLEQT